ncbi:hypothetical protein A9F13_13g01793 [Clavispora lusitaniae]|nr:hypothetical protein A9F13_13g01793 [Clavispora lusitaniae]
MDMSNKNRLSSIYASKPPSRTSSTLNRNSSAKSMLSFLSPALVGGADTRSPSKKRINPTTTDTNPPMFPISEFDSRLDPHSMFEHKVSLSDENDYSRRILHITNPE